MPDNPFGPEAVDAGAFKGEPVPGRHWTAMAVIVGMLVGLAVMVLLVRLLPRDAAGAGLGLNTQGVYDVHPRGRFHFGVTAGPAFMDAARQFDPARTVLWLGASQVYGINNYHPPEHNVAYRVFDALISDQVAVLTLSFPLASPQEHEVMLDSLVGKVRFSGLIIGAAFGDMRHAGLRQEVAQALDDQAVRARIEQTEAGRRLVAEASREQRKTPIAQVQRGELSLMDRTEGWITGRMNEWFGMENFRRAGRAWVLLGVQETRRYLESLRARYTRDLSHYRVEMLEQNYRANWAAWQQMLAVAKAEGVPTLVYVAPRPTDFFPFEPGTYERFKRDLAALALSNGAAFVNIEDAVPNQYWGLVDIGFGFYARDPFHFTAEGHALMANALLPHIRRLVLDRVAGP